MNKYQEAFDQIHADEDLICSTQMKLSAIRRKKKEKKIKNHFVWRAALVCVMIAIIVLLQSYTVTTKAASYISIDSLPSIELTLNKQGKVIDARSYNENGSEILKEVDPTGQGYEDAIDALLSSNAMKNNAAQEDNISITVASYDQEHAQELVRHIDSCHSLEGHQTTTSIEKVSLCEEAHENGMSIGKYAAYLDLKTYDADITLETCHSMSMNEIQESIHSHQEHEEETGNHEEEEACDHDQETSHDHGEDKEESCDHDE